MKLLKRVYYGIRCLRTIDHSTFTLVSNSLELKATGNKYYYFEIFAKFVKEVRLMKK